MPAFHFIRLTFVFVAVAVLQHFRHLFDYYKSSVNKINGGNTNQIAGSFSG